MRTTFLTHATALVLFATVVSAVPSGAQIKIQKEESFANELMFLGDISSGTALNVLGALGGTGTISDIHRLYCRIFHDKLTIGIAVETQNRFDDNMEIALGHDFSSTNESLQSLIDWMDEATNGMSISFEDIEGRGIQINKEKAKDRIHIQILNDLETRTVVGKVILARSNLVKAQSLLNEKNQKKITDKLVDLGLTNHPFLREDDIDLSVDEIVKEEETTEVEVENEEIE